MTLIQRFGSALNLNIHFHILFLDGVYGYRDNRPPRFQRVKAPNKDELEGLVQVISQRVGRCLKRVFSIEIEICGRCGGSVRVIVDASNRCIEDQDIVDRILAHLREKEQEAPARPLLVPPTRAPNGTFPLFAGEGAR